MLAGVLGGTAVHADNCTDTSVANEVLRGPVDAVDPERSAITIAGQRVSIEGKTLAHVTSRDQVSVLTETTDHGLRLHLVNCEAPYVPGSSRIVVTGQITALAEGVALASVGELWVDFTSLLSASPELTLNVGESVVFTGVQPEPGGLLLADEVAYIFTTFSIIGTNAVEAAQSLMHNLSIIGTN